MVTLDLFTKKTRLYYIGLVITIVTASFISIAAVYNLQFESPLMPLYDALLILAIVASFAFIFTAGLGTLHTYIKDGELELAADSLVIDNVRISLDNTKELNLKVRIRTVKSFILERNQIEIVDKNGNVYNRRFAIKSSSQNAEFEKVLDQWRSNGVIFNISYRNI
ncbi:MAG TPA: hypothetical protein VGN20_21475 [Mucilaginibacter sp.]